MADLKTNIELDDARFQRAAKRVARETNTMGKAMERIIRVDAGRSMDELVGKFATFDFAIQSAMRGFRAASAAVSEYREQFPGMTENINEVDAAVQRFQRSVGRDLSVAIDGSAGSLATFVDNFDAMRRAMVDGLAGLMGADVDGVNEAIAIAERQADVQRQRLVLMEMERSTIDQLRATEEDRFRAAGQYVEAENVALDRKLEKITDEARRQKEALKDMELDRAAHARAVELIDQQSLARRTMAQREYTRALEAEDEKRAEAAAKAAEETQRAIDHATRFGNELVANAQREQAERESAAEGLADREAQRDIEIAMLEGKKREAELAGLALRFERERREILRDELLSEQQKADAVARLAEDQQRITGLVMQRVREEQGFRNGGVSGGTLGGPRAQAQQLGIRSTERTAEATTATAADVKKVVDTLGKIFLVLRQPTAATFG